MKNINKDTYCLRALTAFDTHAKSVCCHIDSESPKFSSYNDMIADPSIQNLIKDLLAGVKHPWCKRCWSFESFGLTSLRTSVLDKYDINQLPTSPILRELVIDTGNVCNLSCRTCHPANSTGLFKEFNFKRRIGLEKQKYEPTIRESSFDKLMSVDLSHVNFINFLGGEPFLNKNHSEFLEFLVRKRYAGNITLTYTTNGTVPIPEKEIELLLRFKEIIFFISLDAVNKQFSYIRTNGNWLQLLKNLTSYAKIQKTFSDLNKSFELSSNVTVSALNILYLENTLDWLTSKNISINFGVVEFKPQYGFGIFSDKQREFILDKLSKSKHNMTAIAEFIKNSEFDQNARDMFFKEIEFTESFHGLRAEEYLPELIELVKQN